MAFPSATPSYAGFTSSHTLSADNHAAQHNQEQADIVALANKMGTGSSTPTSALALLGTGTGTSSWGQVSLTAGISGVLPVANGGNGTASSTGSGLPVFATAPSISTPSLSGGGAWTGSPSLTTPTIADFTNAIHTHTSAAGGGQLPFGALLSTIFSGQVQTQVNAGTSGGNLWWINLGGLKLMWGLGAPVAVGTGGSGYTFTLPTFFTTIQSYSASPVNVTVDGRQYCAVDSTGFPSTSSVPVIGTSATNGSTQNQSIVLIGT